jgi:hypothetical protein
MITQRHTTVTVTDSGLEREDVTEAHAMVRALFTSEPATPPSAVGHDLVRAFALPPTGGSVGRKAFLDHRPAVDGLVAWLNAHHGMLHAVVG